MSPSLFDGRMNSHATVVSEFKATCITPELRPGRYYVGVSLSDSVAAAASVARWPVVLVRERPSVGTAVPQELPSTGGMRVRLIGSNFVHGVRHVCRFAPVDRDGGDAVHVFPSYSNATVISSNEVSCQAPARPAGSSSRVTVGDHHSGFGDDASGALVTFANPAVIERIEPAFGPASGGTTVRLYGSGFRAEDVNLCHFGQTATTGASAPAGLDALLVAAADAASGVRKAVSARAGELVTLPTPARVLNSTVIECQSPQAVTTNLIRTGERGAVRARVSIRTVAGRMTEFGPSFTFFTPAIVTSIEPSSGPDVGGTYITVRGGNFLPTQQLACKFGAVAVPAVYVSEGEVGCWTPPAWQAAEAERGAASHSVVPVVVSNNGVDFAPAFPGLDAGSAVARAIAAASQSTANLSDSDAGVIASIRRAAGSAET